MRAKVKASVPARVVDLSAGGAQLEVVSSLRPHVACEIRLQLGEREIVVNSVVRRCRAWGFGFDDRDRRVILYRAGVEFEPLPADVVESLRRELAEQGLGSGVYPAVTVTGDGQGDANVAGGSGAAAAGAPQGKVPAPERDGPVKIRIRADHIREILDKPNKD